MRLSIATANSIWLASCLRGYLQFRHAINRPDISQAACLLRALRANATTAYGRLHHFGEIRSYEDFAKRVPVVDYEHLAPWIRRIMAGEPNILTAAPVTRLIPTSGTSTGRKLIPFTGTLQREFDAAINPWIFDLYRTHPDAALGPAYWSITPAMDSQQKERSAVPIGFDTDSSYLGGLRKNLLSGAILPPAEFRLIGDTTTFRYLTLLCLLRQADLSVVSVWHPSFLSLLLDALPGHWEDLMRDLFDGTCKFDTVLPAAVQRAVRSGPRFQRARQVEQAGFGRTDLIWRKLKVISCWGDAHGEGPLQQLRPRFPGVVIQPKGLLATEAFVSIPFGNVYPLAIRSHFYEFEDDAGRIFLAHELEEGNDYKVIVTTSGGLYRYRLGDQVRVIGFLRKTPCLKFLGRTGVVSDRCGEKLSEAFVAAAIRAVCSRLSEPPRFALLAPEECDQGLRYALFIEAQADSEMGLRLDSALKENPHYLYGRKIGQLLPPEVVQIPGKGYEKYVSREMARGKRLGEIKACALSTDTGWRRHFA